MNKPSNIVVRVYAIITLDEKILLSDEFWFDTPMTKFPGGGLNPGEGIIECLKREIYEELQSEISQATHLYTCEHLIVSDFSPSTQVIPVYYLVQLSDYSRIKASGYRFNFQTLTEGAISHRWTNPKTLQPAELTFKSDRLAFEYYKGKILR